MEKFDIRENKVILSLEEYEYLKEQIKLIEAHKKQERDLKYYKSEIADQRARIDSLQRSSWEYDNIIPKIKDENKELKQELLLLKSFLSKERMGEELAKINEKMLGKWFVSTKDKKYVVEAFKIIFNLIK